MKTAAIYSRKSKYTGKGESIENQINICKDYLSKLGIYDYIIYEDEGYSGKNVDRPEFKKLLADAKKRKFQVLICYRLDRVSRNIADFSNLINTLEKYEISFISVSEQFDTSTAIGRAMMYIASVFAQLERETIAERIRDNMLELAKSGRWLGGQTPTGFKSTPIVYLDSELKERKMFKLEPIEEELQLIKLLYSKYLELKSLSQVEKYCLQNNIKTKMNKDFVKSKIKTILTNPVYVKATKEVFEYLESKGITVVGEPDGIHGLYLYNKRKGKTDYKDISNWICSVAKHEGIIEAKDWLAVQRLLEKNKSMAPRLGKSKVGLLSGLVKCKKCGTTMRVTYGVYSKALGKAPHYYTCRLKVSSGKVRCDNKNAKGDDIEKAVVDAIRNLYLDKDRLIDELSKYVNDISSQNTEKEIQKINATIKQNEDAIGNLTNTLSFTQDSNTAKIIIQKIENLSSENEVLKKKLTELKEAVLIEEARQEKIKFLAKSIEMFDTLFETSSFEDKRRLLTNIIDKVYWDGDTNSIEIIYK
ncbi:recombinase family protein [Caloramator sp. ALD01]|uniref:recombinase family protein n=1 Tax=Caloramator sp. ALD01 TaxID=1031288 RepID=UPI00040C0B75|nr:recombinase family protein [Caloramator sp. ALD01]